MKQRDAAPPRSLARAHAVERLEGRVLLDALPAGPAFPLNDPTPPPRPGHMRPTVAADSRGNFVAVWVNHRAKRWQASELDVLARRFDAAGNPLGPQFVVAGGPGEQGEPVVAMDDDGDFVVAWTDRPSPYFPATVRARRFDAAGQPLGIPFELSAPGASLSDSPAVAMAPGGEFVVAWRSGFPSPPPAPDGWFDYHVFARRFDRFGGGAGPAVRVNADGTKTSPGTAVAMDADGDFAVVWKGFSLEPLYARRFDAQSRPREAPQVVSDSATDDERLPAVAMDDDGDYVVTWTTYRGGQGYVRRYDERSAAWSETLVVGGTPAGGYLANPAVDTDSDGDFAVAWTTYESDLDSDIRVRLFAPDGTPRGGELIADVARRGFPDLHPSVALDEDGDLVVAWGGYDYAIMESAVYARRYFGAAEPQAPHATGVFVAGSRWDSLTGWVLETRGLGDRAHGYEVTAAAPGAARALPWANLDRVTVTFNRGAGAQAGDLVVRGAGGAQYAVSSFAYDPATRSATWTLARPLGAGVITVEFAPAGAAAGGLRSSFNVLPGDVNGDGRVNALDLARLRAMWWRYPSDPWNPADALFCDLDASGRIDARDLLLARRHLGTVLPPPAPAASPATTWVRSDEEDQGG